MSTEIELSGQIQQVQQTSSGVSEVIKAEIDSQVATAKMYPRKVGQSIQRIKELACITQETAEKCFYSLKRKDKDGKPSNIEGESIRLAEIVASQYGNMRYGSRILGNDGKTVIAQGVCHDLETNSGVTKEVHRRITTKSGVTFSDDMIVVTGNAAASIAMRNAIFSVVPKAIIASILPEIKKTAIGQNIPTEERWRRASAYYSGIGVSEKQLMEHLEVSKIVDVTEDHFIHLIGLKNAIEDKVITVAEAFSKENIGASVDDIVSPAGKLQSLVSGGDK